jgi:hypothetical protein
MDATLATPVPSGASKDEVIEFFIHLEAYAGAARVFDSCQFPPYPAGVRTPALDGLEARAGAI